MNNDNSTKRILDVLGHAIELAQNELESSPQEIEQPATPQRSETTLQPVPETGSKSNPLLTSNKIETFYHPNFGTIEATKIGGKPYFKALSILSALGYKNPASVAELCPFKKVIRAPKSNGSVDSVTYLSQYDVHSLINRRKIELLFEFERWIDEEIVPTLCGKPLQKKIYPPMKQFKHDEYGTVLATLVDGEVYYRTIDICKICGYNRTAVGNISDKYYFAGPRDICGSNSTFIKAETVYSVFRRKKLDKIPVTKKMLDWVIYDISEQMRSEFADSDSTIA